LKTARRWRLKEKEEDIQIAQRIIADVKALLTCVPYLLSASHLQQVFTQTNAGEAKSSDREKGR
jgi:hypothetical protein